MTRRSPTSLAKRKAKETATSIYPYVLIHSCGCIAFHLKHIPEEDRPVHACDVIYPDGTIPRDDDPAICHGCREKLMHTDFASHNIRRVQ